MEMVWKVPHPRGYDRRNYSNWVHSLIESDKWQSVLFKTDDTLNWMCHELHTIVDSNQPQRGVSLKKNRGVEQGQLITVIKTSLGGVEKWI